MEQKKLENYKRFRKFLRQIIVLAKKIENADPALYNKTQIEIRKNVAKLQLRSKSGSVPISDDKLADKNLRKQPQLTVTVCRFCAFDVGDGL